MNKTLNISIGKGLNKTIFEFICGYKTNNNGFSQLCTLYVNGERKTQAVVHHTDKTCESYQYKSVMMDALTTYKNEIETNESDILQSDTLKNITECVGFLEDLRNW